MTLYEAQTYPTVLQINPDGNSRIVLVCEHASPFIPPEFNDLGLHSTELKSHAVWDPGAMAIAEYLADWLDAKLVASSVSRLIYDCNRPPEAVGAMSEQSELIKVPGNTNLSTAERTRRTNTYYKPFHAAVREALEGTNDPILVTIHSFTSVFHGAKRDVELGVLHDADQRFADLVLSMAPAHTTLRTQRNAPYGPEDGVTHTLQEHGTKLGHPNVMLEIRNDLIANEVDQTRMARMLSMLLTKACHALPSVRMHT
ncbi:MAG: N-formylglutamate amidohydrolase [Litoreibacter sp.]